jgi:hypothetical protein
MQASQKPINLNVFIHDDTESKGLPSFGQRQFKHLSTKSRYFLVPDLVLIVILVPFPTLVLVAVPDMVLIHIIMQTACDPVVLY